MDLDCGLNFFFFFSFFLNKQKEKFNMKVSKYNSNKDSKMSEHCIKLFGYLKATANLVHLNS